MARFRKRVKRVFAGFKKRRSSRSNGGGSDATGLILAGALYGAGRPYIERVMPSQISNALGGYGDEAVLGVAGYFAAKGKLGNNKLIKNIGKAALVIESARVAGSFTAGMTNQSTTSSGDGWN